jgi:hypothetical protein
VTIFVTIFVDRFWASAWGVVEDGFDFVACLREVWPGVEFERAFDFEAIFPAKEVSRAQCGGRNSAW